MQESRNDISKLINEIQRNQGILDVIKPPDYQRIVAEIVGQNKKLMEISMGRYHGLDLLATYQDEIGKSTRIAVQTAKMNQVVGQNAIAELQKSLAAIGIDKSYLVANSAFTEAAKALAATSIPKIELVDHRALTDLISAYERNQTQFANDLVNRINAIPLDLIAEIHNPSPSDLEDHESLQASLNEPQRSALVTVGFLPMKLIAKIMQNPNEMRNLTPRQFEEFVAEILNQLGFQNIELTPRSADGGKDVIASNVIHGIPLSFYFECKRYADGNKIQLETLRALLGTMAHDSRKVNKGVLVTTSTFTKGCNDFIMSESRLDGKDYDGILGWIGEMKKTM